MQIKILLNLNPDPQEMAKPILDSKEDSLSTLGSPISSSPPSDFQLPSTSTRIYPYFTTRSRSKFNCKLSNSITECRHSLASICCFIFGIVLTIIMITIAWQLNLISFQFSNSSDLYNVDPNSSVKVSENVCTTPVCMHAASRLLNRLDPSQGK